MHGNFLYIGLYRNFCETCIRICYCRKFPIPVLDSEMIEIYANSVSPGSELSEFHLLLASGIFFCCFEYNVLTLLEQELSFIVITVNI